MTSTITTAVPALALSPAGLPIRNHVYTTSDAYRVVVYSDGANLKLASSPNGVTDASWTGHGTTIITSGIPAMTQLIDAVMDGIALYVLVGNPGSSSSVDLYTVPYLGAGTWGSVTKTTPISGLPNVPLAVCAAYGPVDSTIDPGHLAGTTGILHVLVDVGTAWWMFALDCRRTSGPAVSVLSLKIPVSVTGPVGATSLLWYDTGSLYAVTAGSGGLYARAVSYVSGPQTVTTGGGTGVTTYSKPGAGWVWHVLLGQPANATVSGHLVYRGVGTNNGLLYTPVAATSTPNVDLLAQVGGYTYDAGTWTLTLNATTTNVQDVGTNGSLTQIVATIYEHTSGGANLKIGSMSSTITRPNGVTRWTASVSLGSYTMALGSQLAVEVDWNFQGSAHIDDTMVSGGIYDNGYTLLSPTPRLGTQTTQTIDQYTPGPAENPGAALPSVPQGLAVIPTASTPIGVELYGLRQSDGAIVMCKRQGAGGYTPVVAVATPPSVVLAGGLAATMDPTGGDAAVFALAGFSGVNHIGSARRTAGVWGSWAQVDSAASAVQSWAAVDEVALAICAQGVATVDSSTPTVLQYNALGSSGVGPSQPSGLMCIDTPGANDAFGGQSPFTVTTLTPTFQSIFKTPNPGSRCSAIQYQVRRHSDNRMEWDSGQVPLLTGPLSGGQIAHQFGSVGTAPAHALAMGGTAYDVTIYHWDALSNVVSSASAVMSFSVYAAPVAQGPTIPFDPTQTVAINALTGTVQLDVFQADSRPIVAYELLFLDGDTGKTLLDSGIQTLATPMLTALVSGNATVAGSTNVDSTGPLTLGETIILGATDPSGQEVRTVAIAGSTGPPYNNQMSANLGGGFPNGSVIYGRMTSAVQNFFPSLPQFGNVTLQVTLYCTRSDTGAQFAGSVTLPVVITYPDPYPVRDLAVIPVTSNDPLTGGYAQIGFYQDAGDSTHPDAYVWLIEQREWVDDQPGAWEYAETIAASTGRAVLAAYSCGNGKQTDFRVTPYSVIGVAGPSTEFDGVVMNFRLSVWVNSVAQPQLAVELGIQQDGSTGWAWKERQVKTFTAFHRRKALEANRGSLYAQELAAAVTYRLEEGYVDRCLALMKGWDELGELVQVRSIDGKCVICVLDNVYDAPYVLPIYTQVTIDAAHEVGSPQVSKLVVRLA